MKHIGVIIARFQTPYLHEGHHMLVKEVMNQHQKVVIVLGVSPVLASLRNPYDYQIREQMIKDSYPSITVLPLKDYASDTKWSTSLDELLASTFPGRNFILYGSRDSFIPYYSGRYATQEITAVQNFTATAIREQHAEVIRNSEDFRTGILYAYEQMYASVYPTVDIALLKDKRTKLLLGKRNEEEAWRLPGGFVHPDDVSFEVAAKRELEEECGVVGADLKYVGSFRIDDWRYKKERNKIITTLFLVEIQEGNTKAADDIDVVCWVKVEELPSLLECNAIVPEHRQLIMSLIAYLEKETSTL